MAFRKRRFSRPRRFRTPVARKRRTWVTALRSGCLFQHIPWNPPLEGCTTQFKQVLLDNALLETAFSDRLTVRRIVGDIWYVPTPNYGRWVSQEETFFGLATEGNQFLHVGLLNKDLSRDVAGNLVTPTYDAVSSDYDFTEAEWLRTWQHLWEVTDGVPGFTLTSVAAGAVSYQPVWKPDVHTYIVPGTPACNELVTGSGLICIETEGEAECFSCNTPLGASTGSTNVAIPKKWNVHLDMKKRIAMREGNELYLMGSWAIPDVTVPVDGWGLDIYQSIKILVELG